MHIKIIHDVVVSANLAARDPKSVCVYPASCLTSRGDLLCVYRMGAAKHSRDGILIFQRSSDGGCSWLPPVTIYDGLQGAAKESVHTGVVCEVASGVFLAFFTVVEAQKPDAYIFSAEGRQLRQRLCVARSMDGGLSWSAPQEIHLSGVPRNIYVSSRPMILPDGVLLLPIEATGAHGQEMMLACLSNDEGRTFSPAAPIACDETGRLGFGDGKFTLQADGSIVMLTWTYLNSNEETIFVHRCESRDNGRTWSPPKPTNVLCQIMTPQTMADSKLIAAGNVRTPPEGIRLFSSVDGGTTWDTSDSVQLWDPRKLCATGTVLPMKVPLADQQGVWDALPAFTFGSPELVRLGGNEAVMTYYAIVDGVTHIRACRFHVAIGAVAL